jgi:uncharacterized protein (TIGR00369 family)
MVGLPGSYAEALGLVTEPGTPPVLRLPAGDRLLGRPNFIHGGAVAGLLEAAAMATLRDALGDDPATISLLTIAMDYLRSGGAIETRASASIIRMGRRVAHLDARAWQEDAERPITLARVTLLIARDA